MHEGSRWPVAALAILVAAAGTRAEAARPTALQIAAAVRAEKEQVSRIVVDRERAERIIRLIDRRQTLAAQVAQDDAEMAVELSSVEHFVSAVDMQRMLATHAEVRRGLVRALLDTQREIRAQATPEEWARLVEASRPLGRLGNRWLAKP